MLRILKDVHRIERGSTIEVVFQESPQFKARLVHLQVLRVVDFSRVRKHLGFFLQECSDHHVVCRGNKNVQLLVGAPFLDIFERQILVHGLIAVKVPDEFLDGLVMPEEAVFHVLGPRLEVARHLHVGVLPSARLVSSGRS